jgi:PAS domain S-box-containing protein
MNNLPGVFEFLFSLTSNPLAIVDEQSRIVQTNQAFSRWADLPENLLLGSTIATWLTEWGEIREIFLRQFPKTDAPFLPLQSVYQRADGSDVSIGKCTIGEGVFWSVALSPPTQQSIISLPAENPNPVLRVSAEGEVVYANPAAQKLLSEIDTTQSKRVPTDWCSAIQHAIHTQQPHTITFSLQAKHYRVQLIPVNGNALTNLYLNDISELVQAQDTLHLSYEILSSIGNLVIVANEHAEITYISPSVREVLGYEPSTLLGNGWWQIERLARQDVNAEKRYLMEVACRMRPPEAENYESAMRHKDGSVRHLIIKDALGPRNSIIGVCADITPFKKAQAEIQQQRDFAQTILERMGQAVVVTNVSGYFEYVNPAFEQITGYRLAEIKDKTPVDLLPESKRKAMRQVFAERQIGNATIYETGFLNKNGTYIPVIANGVPRMVNGEFRGTISVLTDLTDRRRMEEELRAALKKANEASELKSSFLATMSHEIRTPMTSILGMNELLIRSGLSPEQTVLAKTVEESAKSLLVILNDILDYSKIEAGKMTLRPVIFEVPRLAESVYRLFVPLAEQKQIKFTLEIDQSFKLFLLGDTARIRQVLSNLINNAIKFTQDGFVHIKVAGETRPENELASAENAPVWVKFSISDSGIGISTEQKSLLFEPFSQIDSSSTRKFSGTGLGLAISKRLVMLMNGEIDCISELGKGSTFWFRLPLQRANLLQPALSLPPTAPITPVDPTNTPLIEVKRPILVVEDTLLNQQLFRLQLRQLHFDCEIVGDGESAYEKLVSMPEQYSLALVDVNIPILNGFELTQKIRQAEAGRQHRSIIIAITANAMAGDREQCLAAGMDDYLAKPVALKALEQMLEKWLGTQ